MNKYEICGEVTYLFLNHKNSIVKTMIDTADLEKLLTLNITWGVSKNQFGMMYVHGSKKVKGKSHTLKLHRVLTNCPKGLVVDHYNHDTLDNRQSNLRIVTRSGNLQNKMGPNKNNKSSGIRGVGWQQHAKKWRVQLFVDKKLRHFGYYDSKEEAENVAKRAIADHMPFSREAMGL